MSSVVLVFGPIGSGKTSTCIDLVERLRSIKKNIGGILSKRVIQGGELMGYDCLDVSSGQVFPLVRLLSQVCGPDWFNFRDLKYAFSSSGFKQANRILMRSSKELNTPSVVFIDEFGWLECAGLGLYPGIVRVVESLNNGSMVIIACRTELVEAVEELLRGRVQNVLKCEAGDFEKLWKMIQGSISMC